MLTIPSPKFNSHLTDLIVSLEGLRNRQVTGSTPPWIFFELKGLFHVIEALSSARIEGNHTTLADYIDAEAEDAADDSDRLREITNLTRALNFIDEHIASTEINKLFVLELHKIVVKDLQREGDSRPGAYRDAARRIGGSTHILPQPSDINDLMNELYEFINDETEPRLDLLKIAIAHHRFVWIHPFGNGNGRVVRLLTYAMLCKKGFITTGSARLFNPTAVFSGDREKYYEMLSLADSGKEDDILTWSEYVLSGLKDEIEKSQKFADDEFVQQKILLPAVDWAAEKNVVSELEAKVLRRLARKNAIKAADIRDLWPENRSHVVVSKLIKKLREQKFIRPLKPEGREYVFRFTGNRLTRGILDQMEIQNMLPIKLDELSESGK
jgi:Fic family protein